MDVRTYDCIYTYGTGVDAKTFQRGLSFYLDTALFEAMKNYNWQGQQRVTVYTWLDLNLNPADAINLVNDYLGSRYLGNTVEYYFCNPDTDQVAPIIVSGCIGQMSQLGLNGKEIKPLTGDRRQTPNEIALLNGNTIPLGSLDMSEYVQLISTPDHDWYDWRISCCGDNSYAIYGASGDAFLLTNWISVFPEDFFLSDGVNTEYASDLQYAIEIRLYCTQDTIAPYSIKKVTKIELTYIKLTNDVYTALKDVDFTGAMPHEKDYSNPYSAEGVSGKGGGDGRLPAGSLDDIDPAEIPDLPAISAADLGFITMYNPSVAELKLLSDFMWSGAFDLNTYKKLFSDPMQSIIGLAIVPVAPTTAGSKSVHFGSIDSGVTMPYLSTNYVQVDCGSVSIDKFVGCFMDNDPYTKISIYLPFIGIRQLSADDIVGGSIHVVYNIDVLNGACACFIEHSTRGVLYSYNGSCITNVPLTAVNFSGAIQNAVSAIGSAIGMVAGMATGAAPITAMGAMGLMTSAANTALNSKPTVQRSGNLGGSAGIMSILTPYVIIERPALSVPNNVQHYVGQTSNITMKLGACKGFTVCEYVHLDGLSATTDELMEIESLLKVGVIL